MVEENTVYLHQKMSGRATNGEIFCACCLRSAYKRRGHPQIDRPPPTFR